MERGGDKMTRLGRLANVRFGLKTGANDFFYVRVLSVESGIAKIRCDDESEHLIESEYVREPVMVKAREIVRPRVVAADLAYCFVQLDKGAASRRYAKQYIAWGEASRQNAAGNETGCFHLRPTTSSRPNWYELHAQDYASVAFPMAHKRRAAVAALSPENIHIDNRLYGVYPLDRVDARIIAAGLLSTFSTLCREIYGRANFGQGMLDVKVYEAEQLPMLRSTGGAIAAELVAAFDRISTRPISILYDEVRRPDRVALDDVFLRAVGFEDSQERADVLAELHDAACRKVWERQAKAERTRESRQSFDEWRDSGLPFGVVEEE
jgi:hypothetical protein